MPLVYFKNFSGDFVYPGITFLAMDVLEKKKNKSFICSQAGHEFTEVFQFQPPECCDYRHVPPHPAWVEI